MDNIQTPVHIPNNLNDTEIYVNLFRGNIPSPVRYPYKKLTSLQIDNLKNIDIEIDKDIYSGGIVSLLKENPIYDLKNLQDLIIHQVSKLSDNPDYHQYINEYLILRNTLSDNLSSEKILSSNAYKLQLQLINLANFVLTPLLIQQLSKSNSSLLSLKIGLYIVHLYTENNHMFLQSLDSHPEIKPVDKMLLSMPAKTTLLPPKRKLKQGPVAQATATDVKRVHKDIKETRKANDEALAEGKRRLVSKLYIDLKLKLRRADDRQKEDLKSYIKSLRPSIDTLKKEYLAKGEAPEVIEKLVTYENYPHLPAIWLSKKNQQVLLDVIDGKAELHSTYINQGFIS